MIAICNTVNNMMIRKGVQYDDNRRRVGICGNYRIATLCIVHDRFVQVNRGIVHQCLKGGLMFEIWGKYQGNSELVDSADTMKEARELLNEYRLAFGPAWHLSIRKGKGE